MINYGENNIINDIKQGKKMKHIRNIFIIISIMIMGVQAADTKSKVIPLSKTKFVVLGDNNKEKIVDLSGQDFIVTSLREKGADGIAYAVDRDGVVWWAAVISSGAKGHETPSGIFTIFRKERFYMSKAHPNPNGINNMDFSLWFTQQGHAIHMGNDNAMSHGCIHVGKKGAKTMFNWAQKDKTKVVVTREHYLPFVYYDLRKSGYKEHANTPAYIKEYLKTMVPVDPRM
jgi:lipoprotein-anchoring transpeptidase ErfK/SrfK